MSTKKFSKVMLVTLICLAISHTVFAKGDKIKIATQSSPQCIMYATVSAQILEYLGYEASSVLIEGVAAYQLMEQGDVQSFPCAWLPAQQPAWDKYVTTRKTVAPLSLMTDECLYRLAVPKYVADQGVNSLEDLKKYADKFDKKIYTGPQGSGGAKLVDTTMEAYGLDKWQNMGIAFAALITEMHEKYKRKEWFVFSGWSPHWMNHVMELKYLDDPKLIWGKSSTIMNPVPANLEEKMPNVAKFLKQYKVSQGIANDWIYENAFEKREPSELAVEWIKNNIKIVDIWVTGVTDKSGKKSAFTAIRDALRAK